MKNLKKLIEETVSKVLGEGLTKTYPIVKSIDILNNLFKENLKAEQHQEKENSIDVYVKKYDESVLIKLIELIKTMGYFISKFSINGVQAKFNKDSFFKKTKSLKEPFPIYLKLEAKFDIEINETNSKLYHVTHDRYLSKIKKIGLVPKSQSKNSYHPERIYFVKEEKYAQKIAKEFSNLEYTFEHNYVLLEINVNAINNIKLYEDPNFKELDNVYGYFTFDNIPPNAINFENTKTIDLA
jgi:hypothetical protein